MELNLTEAHYNKLRMQALSHGVDLYPPYTLIKEEKSRLVPYLDFFEHPSEGVYQISMQHCVENHVKHIVDDEMIVWINSYAEDPDNEFWFYFKFGSDGAGDNAEYKNGDVDQSKILASYMVPLALMVRNKKSKKSQYFYLNRMANSWTAITYLRIAFEKENMGKQFNDFAVVFHQSQKNHMTCKYFSLISISTFVLCLISTFIVPEFKVKPNLIICTQCMHRHFPTIICLT